LLQCCFQATWGCLEFLGEAFNMQQSSLWSAMELVSPMTMSWPRPFSVSNFSFGFFFAMPVKYSD
jgi:hypothetical protein